MDSSTGDRNPGYTRIAATRTPEYGSKREVCIEAGENPAHDRVGPDAQSTLLPLGAPSVAGTPVDESQGSTEDVPACRAKL